MWSHLYKMTFLQLFETLLVMPWKARGCKILLFGIDSIYLAHNLLEISTLWTLARKQMGDHMAHVVSPLQNDISATLQNFAHVSKGQRLPNHVVCHWFWLFGNPFTGDIHTSNFGLIAKRGTTWTMSSHLCKTRFLQLIETSLVISGKARGYQMLLFGIYSNWLSLNMKEMSTCQISTWLQMEDCMAYVVPLRICTVYGYRYVQISLYKSICMCMIMYRDMHKFRHHRGKEKELQACTVIINIASYVKIKSCWKTNCNFGAFQQ